jgi:hypothetical protein
MKNLAYSRVPSCMVFVSVGPVEDDHWSRYIDFARATMPSLRPPRSLVVTEGGPPTPAQRQKLNELVMPYVGTAKAAVVTSSGMVRGVLTALGWVTPDIYKAFAPADLDAAMESLDLPRTDMIEIRRLLPLLKKEASGD